MPATLASPPPPRARGTNAARLRRSTENSLFGEMTRLLPLHPFTKKTLDKATTLKMAMAYIKMREFCHEDNEDESNSNQENISPLDLGLHLLPCLDGFLLVILKSGKIIYVTENVSKHLGFTQLDMIGSKVYDYIHRDDKDELDTILSHLEFLPTSLNLQGTHKVPVKFSIRMKCILSTRKAGYLVDGCKIMHCSGHLKCQGMLPADNEGSSWGPNGSGLVLICRNLPCSVGSGIRLSPHMFMFRMGLDLVISYADGEVYFPTGYTPSQLHGKSLYNFIHPMHIQHIQRDHSTLQEKEQVISKYYVFLANGGGWIWLQSYFTVMKTGMPSCDYIIATNQVISERLNSNLILDEQQLCSFNSSGVNYWNNVQFSNNPFVSKTGDSLIPQKYNEMFGKTQSQNAASVEAKSFVNEENCKSKLCETSDFLQASSSHYIRQDYSPLPDYSKSSFDGHNHKANSNYHLQDVTTFNQVNEYKSDQHFLTSNAHYNPPEYSVAVNSAERFMQNNVHNASDDFPENYFSTYPTINSQNSRISKRQELFRLKYSHVDCEPKIANSSSSVVSKSRFDNGRLESSLGECEVECEHDNSLWPSRLISSESSNESEPFDGAAKKRFCNGLPQKSEIFLKLSSTEKRYNYPNSCQQENIIISDTDYVSEPCTTMSKDDDRVSLASSSDLNQDSRSLHFTDESSRLLTKPTVKRYKNSNISREDTKITSDTAHIPKPSVTLLKEDDKFSLSNSPLLNQDSTTLSSNDESSKYCQAKILSPVNITTSQSNSPEISRSIQDMQENPFFYSKNTVDRLKAKDLTYKNGKFLFATCAKSNNDTSFDLYQDMQSSVSRTELDLNYLQMHSITQGEKNSIIENADNRFIESSSPMEYIPISIKKEQSDFFQAKVKREFFTNNRSEANSILNFLIPKQNNEAEVNNNQFSENDYCSLDNGITEKRTVKHNNASMASLSKDSVIDNNILDKLKRTCFPTYGSNSLECESYLQSTPSWNIGRKIQRQCSVPLEFPSNLESDMNMKFQRRHSDHKIITATSSNSVHSDIDCHQNQINQTKVLSSSLESEVSYCISNDRYSSPAFRDDFSEIELISTDSDPENLFSSLTFTESSELVSTLPNTSSDVTNDQSRLLEDVFLL